MKKIEFTKVVKYYADGELYRLKATISLDDDCHNNCCDFSITGELWRKARNGKWVDFASGCIHEYIASHIKSFAPYIKLHLCNYLGQPMYPVENGMYHMRKDFKTGIEYLRITEEEYHKLSPAAVMNDKLYFKYMLFHLGIVSRWEKEANELISFLNSMNDKEWENPYSPEEERFVLRITQEEIDEVESKIEKGYYSEQSINERIEQKKTDETNKIRQAIIDKYNVSTEKARNERDVKLYILDHGLPVDNVIYYDYNKTVKFNWLDYKEQITKEQFENFIGNLEPDKLPDGIKFSIVIRK